MAVFMRPRAFVALNVVVGPELFQRCRDLKPKI
jgi:hypothetical protein